MGSVLQTYASFFSQRGGYYDKIIVNVFALAGCGAIDFFLIPSNKIDHKIVYWYTVLNGQLQLCVSFGSYTCD